MSPGALLEALEAAGIRLELVDGFLQYEGPVGAYTPEFRALVTTHRQTLIGEWRCWECGARSRVLFGIGRIVTCRQCTPKRGPRGRDIDAGSDAAHV